jgi:hypothetical protein
MNFATRPNRKEDKLYYFYDNGREPGQPGRLACLSTLIKSNTSPFDFDCKISFVILSACLLS